MMLSQTNEQAFEYLIEKALVGSTVEERKAAGTDDIDTQRCHQPETRHPGLRTSGQRHHPRLQQGFGLR